VIVSQASTRVWIALALVCCCAAFGCGRGAPSSATQSQASLDGDGATDGLGPAAPMDARERAQWASAADGDPEELMRLATALETIGDLAAAPRRANDPEDAPELHEGCASLLALSRAGERPRERRVLAIRALRMLADRGCVKRADIPAELDAR